MKKRNVIVHDGRTDLALVCYGIHNTLSGGTTMSFLDEESEKSQRNTDEKLLEGLVIIRKALVYKKVIKKRLYLY
jgi:hypothetical protein